MASSPTSLTIRSYQVGFGDCFLLQFHYAGGDDRNMLIDFGTTGVPKLMKTKPSVLMPFVATQIAKHCGRDDANDKPGKLHVLVATHRHQDHISGFATDESNGGSGKTIAALMPDVVIQPWTEDPTAARTAKQAKSPVQKKIAGFRSGLEAMHGVAEAVSAFANRELAKAAAGKPAALSKRSLEKLRFVGEDNIKNPSAVKSLIDMGRGSGAQAVYVNYGMKLDAILQNALPGVAVTVLGPPNLAQTDSIKTMARRDEIEFWHLISGPAKVAAGLPLANGLPKRTPRGAKVGADAHELPAQARWFARRLTALRAAQVFEIVRSLDDQMNNTSVILLIEFGGRKLLFPGDAQLENWRYALKEVGNGVEAKKNVERLADIDLYKVGHHGSLNATPKKMLWGELKKRGAAGPGRLLTILSTMPGKHPGGASGGGEVPRGKLLDALEADTDLASTDALKKSAKFENAAWFNTVEI